MQRFVAAWAEAHFGNIPLNPAQYFNNFSEAVLGITNDMRAKPAYLELEHRDSQVGIIS